MGRAPHRVTGEGGARETDPEVWWDALREAVAAGLKESGVDPSTVTGIAVAGQQHGLVVLDRTGRPLRPALLWNDTRSAPQAAALTEALGGPDAWTARTGSVPVASMTATKWQWLRENDPAVADATAAVRLPHDFLTERLAGVVGHRPGGRLGHQLVLHRHRRLRPRTARAARASTPALLPPVAATGATRVGIAHGRRGRRTRPARGHAVAAGTGDNMSAAVGLGLGGAGLLDHPVLSLGHLGHCVRGDPHPSRCTRALRFRRVRTAPTCRWAAP